MLQTGDTANYENQEQHKSCVHCQLAASAPLYLKEDLEHSKPFCCYGCMSVFQVLHGQGLEHFYELKEQTGTFKQVAPAQVLDERFEYMDRKEFLDDYTQTTLDGNRVLSLYLDGIHCIACLWLVEKLPDFCEGVLKAQLNMEESVVKVWLSPTVPIAPVAQKLNSFGLTPHPLKLDENADEFKRKEERRELLRIGVAGAAAMNVMLYSISLYSGAPQAYTKIFGIIIALFSLPAITYSAWPFYKAAWGAFQNKKLSLDLPISIALVYGSIRGFTEIMQGGREFYFDTLSVLVFLLLISRYTVKKWGRQGLALNSLSSFLGLRSVLLQNSQTQTWSEVHPDYLKPDNIIKVQSGQTLPVDGILLDSAAQVQTSMMTGEPAPQDKNEGDELLAGFQNSGASLNYKVSATKDQSLLAQLLQEVELQSKSKTFYSTLANKISSRLVLGVLFLAVGVFIYYAFQGAMGEGERRALSLIIITCPCALGLSTPLALSRTLSKAQKRGLILKDENLFERVNQIQNIVLDKTGTLTDGKFGLLSKTSFGVEQSYCDKIVKALEKSSCHPLGKTLYQSLPAEEIGLTDIKETLGKGVSGLYNGHFFEVKNAPERKSQKGVTKLLALYQDRKMIAEYTLGDQLRKEVKPLIKKWQKKGKNFWIISGDSKPGVKKISEDLCLKPNQVFWDKLPKDKAQIVENMSPVIMVGDGANDSLALKKADVAIAVRGSMPLALKTCGIYFIKEGLSPLNELLELSDSAVKLIKRNLRVSLAYNILGSTLAISGYINPLMAAILMPLSSFSVLGATLIGTKQKPEIDEESAWIS